MEQQEQTAVDWLVGEIKKMKIGNNQLLIYYEDLDYLIEKAKEMEKQQNKKYLLMGAVIVADEYGKTD